MLKKNVYLGVFFGVLLIFSFIFIYGIEDYQMPTPAAELEPAEVEEEPVEDVASYTGTGEGYGGEMTVEVFLDEGEIVDIKVIEHQETDDFALPAFEDLTEAVIEAQSTDVDLISGATASSEGFLAAVDAALAQADPTEIPAAESYTGTAEGYGGDLTVEVLLTEEEILNIRVIEHSETEGLAEPALEQTPQDIIDAQSTNVDAVSGATVTSEAIMAAVQVALDEAGWEPDEVPEPDEEEAEVYTGTAEGFIDDITVEVTVLDGEITGIEVVEQDETPDYFDDAVPTITDRIIEAQSTEVDVVSGATGTSEGIMAAVDNALADVELEDPEEEPVEDPEPTVEPELEAAYTLTTTAEGYGGEMTVEVDVMIADVRVVEHRETEGLAEPALEEVPRAIVETQSTDVDVVTGVTRTSEAIMEAVRQAFIAEVEPEFDLEDGSYTGSGSGFYDDIEIEVVIEDGRIVSIEVISHEDVPDNAEPAFEKLISDILASQSPDQDTVSGATYSSEGFLEALEDALGL